MKPKLTMHKISYLFTKQDLKQLCFTGFLDISPMPIQVINLCRIWYNGISSQVFSFQWPEEPTFDEQIKNNP